MELLINGMKSEKCQWKVHSIQGQAQSQGEAEVLCDVVGTCNDWSKRNRECCVLGEVWGWEHGDLG